MAVLAFHNVQSNNCTAYPDFQAGMYGSAYATEHIPLDGY